MMIEKDKTIDSFKRYIQSQENTLDDYYKMDEEYYKDQIEELELSIKLLKMVLNLIEEQNIENREIRSANEYWTMQYCNTKNNTIPKSKIKNRINELENSNIEVELDLKEQFEIDILKKILEENEI